MNELFERNSPDCCLEIPQFNFNYSCLGTEMAPSSLHNFNLLFGKVKESNPEAALDDKSLVFSNQNIDTDCKLIYLCRQAEKS
jgi:hypothetical protein